MSNGAPEGPLLKRALDAFSTAAELHGAAREAALAELDPAVRDIVVAMLDKADVPPRVDLSDVWLHLQTHVNTEPAGPAPTQIDEFTIVRELGRGAHGVVYEAVQTSPSRRVAVKLLRPLAASARRRLLDEAERLAHLEHPAFPWVVRAGEDDGRAFIAMQLVDGVPFDVWAASVPPAQRLEAVLALCEAMAFAHNRGTLHRDLKPSNVLVDLQGRVKVIDLGLACATDDVLVTTAGTLAYLPPEGRPSVAGDTYAIAVVAWQALSGRTPWDVTGMGVRRAAEAKRGPLPPMPAVPGLSGPAIERALARALHPDPERRTPTPQALTRDLRAASSPPRRVAWLAGAVALGAAALAWAARGPDLAEVERAAAARRADGQEALASEGLRVATAELGRSEALTALWSRHAAALTSPVLRRHAWAEAWNAAPNARIAAAPAAALARDRLAALDWDALEVLLRVADADGVDIPDIAADVRAAHRRWSPEDPLLGGWLGSTLLPVPGAAAAVDGDTLVIAGHGLTRLRVDTLAVVGALAVADLAADGGVWAVEHGGQHYVFANLLQGSALWRWDGSGAAPILTLPSRLHDVEPEGKGALLAFGDPLRYVARVALPDGRRHDRTAFPDLGSDVQDLLRIEGGWAAAYGPWTAYAVVAVGDDASVQGPALVSGSTRLAALPGGQLAAVTGSLYAAAGTRAGAAPTGLHIGAAGPVLTPTLAGPAVDPWATRGLWPADLDGDGDTDLIAALALADRVATWAIERTADGWRGRIIERMQVLAVLQADNDPAMEVIARLPDHADALWLLGRGDTAPPPVDRAAATVRAPLGLPDRPQHVGWAGLPTSTPRRALLLAAAGQGARLAREVAASGPPDVLAVVTGQLLAFQHGAAARQALEHADEALVREADLTATLAELTRIGGGAPPTGASTPPPGRTRVAPHDWRFPHPAGLSVADGALRVTGYGGDVLLAELDLADVDNVDVLAIFDLDRTEAGSRLALSLTRDGQQVASTTLSAWGGAGEVHREFGCDGPGFPIDEPYATIQPFNAPQQVVVRLRAGPAGTGCSFGVVGRLARAADGAPAASAGTWTLQLRAGSADVPVAIVDARLVAVDVGGARVVPPAWGPDQDIVAGHLQAAWSAMAPSSAREAVGVDLGIGRVGPWLVAEPDDALSRHLRRAPELWWPALQAALPVDRLPEVFRMAWSSPLLAEADAGTRAALLSSFADRLPLSSGEDCAFAWRRARWLRAAGYPDRAAQVLERILNGCPNQPPRLAAGLEWAAALEEGGRLPEARAVCAATAAQAPILALFVHDAAWSGLTDVCGP